VLVPTTPMHLVRRRIAHALTACSGYVAAVWRSHSTTLSRCCSRPHEPRTRCCSLECIFRSHFVGSLHLLMLGFDFAALASPCTTTSTVTSSPIMALPLTTVAPLLGSCCAFFAGACNHHVAVVVRLLLLPALLVLSTSLHLTALVMLFACASSSPTWACAPQVGATTLFEDNQTCVLRQDVRVAGFHSAHAASRRTLPLAPRASTSSKKALKSTA
jgi:hypothetical protein